VEIRSDQIRPPGYLARNVCPALPKSPDALAPVTVKVVRPQLSVSQSVALDRLVSGDTRQLPTNTQPRPLFDGHVITRLSGKFLHPRGHAVQRRESRTDMLGDRRPCDGAAVLSLRAAPYPVAARRRVVTVLVTPLHVDEPAPAALVGVDFFFFKFAATLSCGLWRYSGVMFFLLSAISWPWHATLERMSANTAVLAQEPRRRAESWRSAAASSARWIGSRRAQSRSSAVERAIWLADAAYSEAFRRKARDGRRAGTRVCACLITCCGPESCTF